MLILSCCIWSLPGSTDQILDQIAAAGFDLIDVKPDTLSSEGSRRRAARLGLRVSSVGASFGIPEGAALDSPEPGENAEAMRHMREGLSTSKDLGAAVVYLLPGTRDDSASLSRYARSVESLAETAASFGLKLCIEHFPDTALCTASGTLEFIHGIAHPNLYLLFDIGHIQISGEDPAETIRQAGDRLGYVHLDDNDGKGDLHLALTEGILTEEVLDRTFDALDEIGYTEPVSIELNPNLPEPAESVKRSKRLVERIAGL